MKNNNETNWGKAPTNKDKNIGFDGYIGNLIYEYIDEYFDKKYQWNKNWSKLIYILGKTLRNDINNIIDILKLFCWKNWYMYCTIFDIQQ